MIAKPNPVRVYSGGRIEALNSHGLQPLGEAVDVVFKCAERHIAVFFPRTFADRSPHMRMLKGFQSDNVAAFADVEAKLAVEILRYCKVRDDEVKMIH